jgi:hypothetical protein
VCDDDWESNLGEGSENMYVGAGAGEMGMGTYRERDGDVRPRWYR